MTTRTKFKLSGPAITAILLAFTLVIELGVAVTIFANERAARQSDVARQSVFQRPDISWRKSHSPSIVLPKTQSAGEVHLPDDERVIGVEIDGVARAYQFTAFQGKSAHLVNDVIHGTAVSISYCDISGCLRTLTAPAASAPLDLEVGGVLDGEMVLKHDDRMFFQRSGKQVDANHAEPSLPYSVATPTVTTWGQWRTAHPETQVYLGPGRLKGTAQ